MEKFAFISRHQPTPGQRELAKKQDIHLDYIGDLDAFSVCPQRVAREGVFDGVVEVCPQRMAREGVFDGVVVVHPAAAMNLCHAYRIGVFQNANRAPVGERPTFEAVEFFVYNRIPEDFSQ